MAEPSPNSRRPAAPVNFIEPDAPERGMALCLSGGGYRAMLFHVGAILRLNQAALLPKLKRVSSVSGDNQVRSLRKRQVIAAFIDATDGHDGAYWGIRSDIANYELADSLSCPLERTMELAATPTRLKRLEPDHQERLINWGYAVCDAALRKHCATSLQAYGVKVNQSPEFPYPIGV